VRRRRVVASQPPMTMVALEAFKLMNAAHQQMREEIDRLRHENEALRREVRRHG
jgi:SMC interacting uncharacterized protein involved in chromosome segregation